jgi:SAM-dependent methyltransferase
LGLHLACQARTSLFTYFGASKKKAVDETKGLRKIFRRFNVPDDGRILDFSCGIGRHSILLSEMGYDVIGYDPSSFYLREAKKTTLRTLRSSNKKPLFLRGNPYQSSSILSTNKVMNFDAIIIMDNSFGYFGKSEDVLMLSELFKVASKHCLLIIETENRDWRLSNFEPTTFFTSDTVEMHTVWRFNFETSVSTGMAKFYQKTGNEINNLQLALKINILYRLYSLHELREILASSGWLYKEGYDDIEPLRPFSNDSLSIFSASVRQ